MDTGKLTINQCQTLAKNNGFDSMQFYLHGPKGKLKAKWIDAYMGLFKVDKEEGFITIKQIEFINDIFCTLTGEVLGANN